MKKSEPLSSRQPSSPPSKSNDSKLVLPEAENARSIEALVGGLSLKGLEGFCQRFATGLHAGVDILRLLESEGKHGSSRHKEVAQSMYQLIRSGESLSGAMAHQGNYFPRLLMRMLRAGEHSGRIERCFAEMADHYRELKRARAMFLGQITFPMISLGLAILVITLMILINGFMRSGSATEEPFDVTGVGLRGTSGVLIFWTFLACIGGFLGLLVFGIWKNWFDCHKTLVPIVRNVPVLGPVFTNTAMARLSMTLSMMLGAGVDARRSIRESLLSTGNNYYISGVELAESQIEKGKSFSEALGSTGLLPDDFLQMLEVGELSGSDSESLERLAVTYREKAIAALSQLAIVAGMLIWLMIAGLILFAIFMIVMQIVEVYSGALKGL